jgi:hypothetical protein
MNAYLASFLGGFAGGLLGSYVGSLIVLLVTRTRPTFRPAPPLPDDILRHFRDQADKGRRMDI